MGRTWTFRADSELDPILKEWTDKSEKSFHVRQALRQYLSAPKYQFREVTDMVQDIEINQEIEISFDEWK